MAGDAPMWLASMLAIAGVAVLRVSWGRAKRSLPLNLSGWAALITALVVADSAAGEWGVTIAILVATGAAFVALAFAAEGGQFQQAGFPTVICGPGSIEQAHQPDEWIALSELEKGAAFMARLADRLG